VIGDQAERLRLIVEDLKRFNDVAKSSRVITVTSGKGGVGKTNISVNLAINLAMRGFRVALLDADFGLSNVDVILGTISRYSFVDLLKNDIGLEDILTTGPAGIKFISGGSGAKELLYIDEAQIEIIIKKMSILDEITDIIIIDTGAGINHSIAKFIQASDEVILVITPEPTSLTDGYALIKSSIDVINTAKINVIFNMVSDENEAMDIERRFLITLERFLGMKVKSLGFISRDDNVYKAVKQQQPFLMRYPQCKASKQIRVVADKLLETKGEEVYRNDYSRKGIKGFLSRLLKGA